MSNIVISPWFDPDVLPVRPGVYMVDYAEDPLYPGSKEYQYFDGHEWFFGSNNVEDTYSVYLTSAFVRDHRFFQRRWAGILK